MEAAEYASGKCRSFVRGMRIERLCPADARLVCTESGKFARIFLPRRVRSGRCDVAQAEATMKIGIGQHRLFDRDRCFCGDGFGKTQLQVEKVAIAFGFHAAIASGATPGSPALSQ